MDFTNMKSRINEYTSEGLEAVQIQLIMSKILVLYMCIHIGINSTEFDYYLVNVYVPDPILSSKYLTVN